MSKQEVAVISQEELDNLAALAGAEKQEGSFLPQLKINYDDEDADGKEIKKGLFTLTNMDIRIYASEVDFRPLTQHFQWSQYDSVSEKTTNRTRFVTTLMGTDEPRDEKGTLKCGKPSSKELKANPHLAKQYEDITCYRHIQGLTTITGKDADGNVHTLTDVPSSLRLKGANFAPFEDEYFSKLGKGRIWDHVIPLYAKKEKNGASTYWVIHFDKVDFTNRVPVTVPVYNAAKELLERIEITNKEIDKKYYDVLHGRATDDNAINALKSVGGLEDDMNDDIPF